jgi:hypothetical protein
VERRRLIEPAEDLMGEFVHDDDAAIADRAEKQAVLIV